MNNYSPKGQKYISYLCILTLSCCICLAGSTKYRQARAQVKYCNPTYLRDCYLYTGRRSRHEPYLTNSSSTLVYDFTNNVTVVMKFSLNKNIFKTAYKVCDGLSTKWLSEYLKKFSNVPLKCPLKAGRYEMFDMEIPPRNFPIPVPKGNLDVEVQMIATSTKELLFSATGFLQVE